MSDPFALAQAESDQNLAKEQDRMNEKIQRIDELYQLLAKDRQKFEELNINFRRTNLNRNSEPCIVIALIKEDDSIWNILRYTYTFEAEGAYDEKNEWNEKYQRWYGGTRSTSLGSTALEAATTIAASAIKGKLPERSCASDGNDLDETKLWKDVHGDKTSGAADSNDDTHLFVIGLIAAFGFIAWLITKIH